MTDRIRVVHPEGGPLMTKQAMKDAVDVNKIIARHAAANMPLPLNGRQAVYGDFSSRLSYHECLNSMLAGQQEFNMLPAQVRKYCDNDLGKFLEMVESEEGRARLGELGMKDFQVPEALVAPVEPVVEPVVEPD